MDSQHEGRCNCKKYNSRLPTPQFPLLDQLNFKPSSQDPSSPSPAPFPATSTGRDKVPELTREVLNQDLIMVSYFSGTRHLSHGLLDWMKLYVRLQSWNLGNEDALTPDDLAIVENSGLIPILPTLRKKPRLERDGLALQPGSMDQPLQQQHYTRTEASSSPLLLSDCKNPPAKLHCVHKTAANLAITDIAATATKASYPALIPNSLVPLKEMTLSLIMSLANAENSAQKAAGTEPESETALTADQKPETASNHTPVSAWSQDLEHAPLNEKCKLTKEKTDRSIHRHRAIKPIIVELGSVVEMKPEPKIKPVPESMHLLKVTPVTVSERTQKLEIAPINNNSNLPKKDATTLSVTEVLYKLHAQKPDTIEPLFSAKTLPESISTTECAPVLQTATKLKLYSIDTQRKTSNKEMNEVDEISVPEFINRLHAYKPVTAKPSTKAKTKPEPSIECASVSESDLKVENASINTTYKVLKKKVRKAIKRDYGSDYAPKRRHSHCTRTHHAVRSPLEDKIMASEFINRLIPHMSTTPEKKPEPTTQRSCVSEHTLQLDPTPIDTKQKHWNEEEINKTDRISASEFSAQTSAKTKPATKTKTTPEFTTEGAPVSESALKIGPAPIDTEGKLSREQLNMVINTQNGEAPLSAVERRPHVCARRRKKEKYTESEFINRLIAHMSASKAETKPEPTTKCAYVSENTLQLDPTAIDNKQEHWNEEEINKTEKMSISEFIDRLSAQTSATEKHATKSKTTPEFTTEGAPVSENALKIESAPMDTEEKLSREDTNKVINTQNGEAPPSAAKRRRKKDKITESEFINRLIAHMSATKAETKPEPTTKCAYVSENTLQLDPTPVDTKQKQWNEEEINKTEKISTSELFTRLGAQTSAKTKPATKTKTTPELTTEGAPVPESALKIEPAPIDTEGKLSKEQLNKVINTQNGEAPPSAAERRPHDCARRRKKEKYTESEFINRLIAHMSASKAVTKPESTTKCAYVSENTLQLDPTAIDNKQEHWNEEEINKTEKMSISEFIDRLSAQTSATEKHATKSKTTPEFTTEGAPVSENALKIESAPMDTEEKLSREDTNKMINTQNGEAPPSAAKRRRKKDKITESEFINRLIAHMSATKAKTKPEPTTKCAYVSENTLQLDPTPIDTKQKHWNEEEINKTEKISTSELFTRLGAHTLATDKHATKTKTTPEFKIDGIPVSERALKIEPNPMDTEGKLSKEEMNKEISTQNDDAPPPSAKRRRSDSALRRKKEKYTESEFINRLIAHMSASKAETKPEPTTKCAYVSENILQIDPTAIDNKQEHWNEEEINKTEKNTISEFINRLSAQTSATEKHATKSKTTTEFTTEGDPVSENALKIEPAPIDTKGSTLSRDEMNKVINTQNGEEPPSAAKRRLHVSARRRKKDKITESEFIYRLNALIMSKTKAETKPEPTAKNNADLQSTQTLQALPPYENTKLLKEEAINETFVSTSGSFNRIHANVPAASETKLEPEIERAPVLESMQNVEPSSVKRKRSRKRKRSKKDRSTPEMWATPASPSPACDTYSTHFEKVRLTYYDYFNFLEHEFDEITQTDHDC